VIVVVPVPLSEVICASDGIAVNLAVRAAVAIDDAMVDGLAPDNLLSPVMVGKSTCGKAAHRQ